jgi:hypothetical protein
MKAVRPNHSVNQTPAGGAPPANDSSAPVTLSRWASGLAHMSRLAAITVGMALVVPTAAVACQCAPLSLSAGIDHADLVLVGRVTSLAVLDHVMVQPVEAFKGSRSKSLTIAPGRSDCDFFLPPVEPRVGEEYLRYLRKLEGRLNASRCLASGTVVEKATELRALRAWSRPNVQPGVRGGAPVHGF